MSGSNLDRPTLRVPAGLLGMVALVLAVEASIVRLRLDLVTPLGESWRFAASAAESSAVGSDVLCLGDSLVKYGILPKVIEARTGQKAFSLAISGGTTPSAFFLLRRALEAGAKPRAIVVDFDALMPLGESPSVLPTYSELAGVRDCLDLCWSSGRLDVLAATMTAEVCPSWRYRFEIRKAIRGSLAGLSLSDRASVASHQRVWNRERGAQPTEPGRKHALEESTVIDWICPERWTCPPLDEAYIDRFLDLAGSRGITVYWLLPPLAPEVHARRALRGSDATYGRFAKTVAARHSNAVVLDARNSGYDDSVHVDHLHLDKRGATVLSVDVALALAAREPEPLAWVELPAFDGRSGDEPAPAPAPALARSRSLGVPR